MEKTAKVSVIQMSGETLELDVEPDITAARLKEELSKILHVPSAAQNLIVDSMIVDGDDALHSKCGPNGDATLVVTLFVSWESALTHLSAFEPWSAEWFQACAHIQDTVAACASHARSDDSQFVRAMTMLCEHENSELRWSATDALAAVASQGNEMAITQLCKCLDDGHSLVRRAAASALAPFVQKGDPAVVAAFADHLDDTDVKVRSLVQQALSTARW